METGTKRKRTGGNERQKQFTVKRKMSEWERNQSTGLNVTAAEEQIQGNSLLMKDCRDRGRERGGV